MPPAVNSIVADHDRPAAATALNDAQAWLSADRSRQLLVLVDSADALLEEEAASALESSSATDAGELFPVSSRLAASMVECHERLKFVLAGSLTVLRASRLLHYPLADRGCIRLTPLLDDGGWADAQTLVRQLLADVRTASSTVTDQVLSLANYAPETIRSLAGTLAERFQAAPHDSNPVADIIASREGSRLLTAGLRATLALDPRFGVLVYSLALAYWQGLSWADGSDAAVSGAWLRDQGATWWEEGFRDAWTEDAFGDLLDDMLELGLLYEVSPDRFVLGSPNLVQFLGNEEELVGQLYRQCTSESEPFDLEYEYAPTRFRPRLVAALGGRSPLTAQQLSLVLGPTSPRIAVVFGTPAAGIQDVGKDRVTGWLATRRHAAPAARRARLASARRGHGGSSGWTGSGLRTVVLVPPEWSWDEAWIGRMAEYLHHPQADWPRRRGWCSSRIQPPRCACWRRPEMTR